MSSLNILVLGSATVDVLVNGIDPTISSKYNKIDAQSIDFLSGGGGVNVATNYIELGCQVRLACSVGDDREGRYLINDLQHVGINTDYIEINPDYPTGRSVILLSPNGEPTVYTQRAASTVLNLNKLSQVQNFDLVYSASLSTHAFYEFERLIQQCKRPPKIAMNPGMRQLKEPLSATEVVRISDLLCLNYQEALVLAETLGLARQTSPLALAEQLLSHGVSALLLTLGAKGSMYVDQQGHEQIPASHHTIVSAIGAGDCFCSTFSLYWREGISPKMALTQARDRTDLILQRMGANRLPLLLKETHA